MTAAIVTQEQADAYVAALRKSGSIDGCCARVSELEAALLQIARTPSRDWHLCASIARAALNGKDT